MTTTSITTTMMTDFLLPFFSIFLVLLVGGGYLTVRALLRRPKLSRAAIAKVKSQWMHVIAMEDNAAKVLEGAKVCDAVFKQLGYKGTFGEKLKQVGPRLQNEQAVWDALKLRNRVAHEVGVTVSDAEANRSIKAFWKAIQTLL